MKGTLPLLLLFFATGQLLAADKHAQHHNNADKEIRHAVKSLSLNHGKKWEVDQTMKTNMEAINTQLSKIKTLVGTNKVTSENYVELGNVISTSTLNIARECKMEQKKDETFHTVLGDLTAVSEDLSKPKNAKHALEKLTQTLNLYSKYFDHTFAK